MIDYFYLYYQLNYTEPIMKVKQLHLQNYGRFEDLIINFAPTAEKTSNVTIIIGNNGAGKSQILEAMARDLHWFICGVQSNMNGLNIDKKYIKNGKNDVNITLQADFTENNLDKDNSLLAQWNISNVRDGRNNSFKNNTEELKVITDKFRENLTLDNNLSLPLIMFYSIQRTIFYQSNADIVPNPFEQMDAYHACLDEKPIDFSDFLKWFRNQEDIENEILRYATDNLNNELHYRSIQEEKIKKLWEDYHNMLTEASKFDHVNNQELHQVKTNLQKFKSQIEEVEALAESTKSLFEYAEDLKNSAQNNKLRFTTLTAIKEAIEYFTNFKNPRVRRQGIPTMIVEKDGKELDVNQLSQGEKSLLALVGDIARRLAILNPSLDNALEGEGVVMIDEVDLHLHPKWQHDLVDKLVKTFPNVQFILTTHSPHIISDRSDILVYALDNGELIQVPNIYGEDVNTVLTKVFAVPVRDKKVQQEFDDIAELIANHEFDKAEKNIIRLEKEMPQNLELLRCRLHLTKTKDKLAKKQ